MAQKRPRPRAPFVVTVALAAAAGACGGSTSQDSGAAGAGGSGAGGTGAGPGGGGSGGAIGGSGGGGTGGFGNTPGGGGCGANPPSIPCPATPPPEGSACPTNSDPCFGWWGTTCYYPDPCGGTAELVMDCAGSTWTVTSGAPTCKCPASAPVVGAPCAVPATETCSYSKGCCPDMYQCNQGKWTGVPVTCNPPPLICPATPPQSGTPCDPCTMGGECSYDTCSALGKLTKASCVSGSWSVSGAPCVLDAGTD